MFDHYATLGVTFDAPIEVIKAAYRALAQKHHPDRNANAQTANERTARVNEAYRVLSDPTSRAAYDASRRDQQSQSSRVPVPRTQTQVKGTAAGHDFTLCFVSGQIISNDLWNETHVSSRGGGGMTIAGFGYNSAPKVSSRNVKKQSIGIRTFSRDIFVDQAGAHIPIAIGQQVELVHAMGLKREGVVAIVNHSSGQWFWIGSQMDAGSLVRKPGAQVVDFGYYLVVVVFCALVLWALWVRDSGFFGWAAFIVLGIPALLGGATPVLYRTANSIGVAMRSHINRAVRQSARR